MTRVMGIYTYKRVELIDSKPMMHTFVFSEVHGVQGPNEVIQCIANVLDNIPKADHVVFEMDNCCSQNKNRFFVYYCHALVLRGYCKKVSIIYRLKGHTYLNNDRVFGTIAKHLKRHTIIHPNQVPKLIEASINKKNHTQQKSQYLTYNQFGDWKTALVKGPHLENLAFHITKQQILQMQESDPSNIRFKKAVKDEWSTKKIVKDDIKTLTASDMFLEFKPYLKLQPAYDNPPVPKNFPKKINGLKELLTIFDADELLHEIDWIEALGYVVVPKKHSKNKHIASKKSDAVKAG